MKGILVAAGKGSRFGGTCKALLKIDNKFLIEYPLMNMKNLGILEVIIVQYRDQIQEKFGDNYFGMKLNYVKQEERKGIAHAVSLTKELIKGDNFLIILGDIIYKGDLDLMKTAFESQDLDCMVGFKMTKDKEEIKKSYGFFEDRYVEKPEDVSEFSSFLGLGIYMATPKFFEAIKKTKPGRNSEIQITDTLNQITKIKPFLLNGFYQNINTKEDLESYHG